MKHPYFVILHHPNNEELMPLMEYEVLMQFATREAAEKAAEEYRWGHGEAGKKLDYEIFRTGETKWVKK